MDLAVLQTVRLKGGMADSATVASLTGGDDRAVQAELDLLVEAGHVQERRGRYRLAPDGRAVLRAALADERSGLDSDALDELWAAFTGLDTRLKQICQDWQLRGGEPNDHSDADHDAAVIDRLDALHDELRPLAVRVVGVVPRLVRYPDRLDSALARLRAGETKYFASPLTDSYHQVFHELHEELYDATGRDRATEEIAAP